MPNILFNCFISPSSIVMLHHCLVDADEMSTQIRKHWDIQMQADYTEYVLHPKAFGNNYEIVIHISHAYVALWNFILVMVLSLVWKLESAYLIISYFTGFDPVKTIWHTSSGKSIPSQWHDAAYYNKQLVNGMEAGIVHLKKLKYSNYLIGLSSVWTKRPMIMRILHW